MIKAFRCDFHIHTCLSPCADLGMYPTALVRKALEAGLEVIAVCDHNASENVAAVMAAARSKGLTVLPGMEITSREEVHLLALFERIDPLLRLQEIIYSRLPGVNDEARFGCQAIVNAADEVEGFHPGLLIGATGFSVSDLIGRIHRLNGIAVASHIDRESFSVISQLGFIDPGVPFDALEVSRRTTLSDARRRYPELDGFAFLTSSDAHRTEEIGTAWTEIFLAEPTLSELKMAFAGRAGRYIVG
jgi:hypothetical protein